MKHLSVWPRENLQKRAPLRNTLFQFDEKINNTCQNTLQNTFILSLWQKLRAQANYFHFRPSNRLFDQLDIMQFYSYQLISPNMSYWGSNTSRPILFARKKSFEKSNFFMVKIKIFQILHWQILRHLLPTASKMWTHFYERFCISVQNLK